MLAAWNNPSNVQNFNGVKIEYKTGSQAAWTPGTGTQIYQGTGTSAGAGQRSTVYLEMIAKAVSIRVKRGEAFEAVIKSYNLSVEDEAKVREAVV